MVGNVFKNATKELKNFPVSDKNFELGFIGSKLKVTFAADGAHIQNPGAVLLGNLIADSNYLNSELAENLYAKQGGKLTESQRKIYMGPHTLFETPNK